VEHYNKIYDGDIKFLIPSNPPTWITESLQHFGYHNDQLIEWNQRSAKVKNLILPSNRRIEYLSTNSSPFDDFSLKIVSARAIRWVRRRATKNLEGAREPSQSFSNKVIISRGDVGRRQIKNKKQVYKQLYELGFKEYKLSKLSFVDQVRLFSEANFVIGPHGAGFTNLVFSNNCNMIEIFGSNYIVPTYYLLSNIMSHNYGCIVGNQQPGGTRDGQIEVDLEELKRLIKQINAREEI
jgi:capsular polysaccharide biosynthesis protein